MQYETVIGLEVHSQLLTKSKMFCSCSADYQDAGPNTIVCEVCIGMPGVLPVINRTAVELVIRTGIALGCSISKYTKFDRKNYFYPDLMKGYQISQYDHPIAEGGCVSVEVDGEVRPIRITRVHLEEDVSRLTHRNSIGGPGYSLLDINRSGVPLMEVVSEPDIRSPEEARSYLTALRSIIRYIGVSTANMEEGSFRCDANISVRKRGTSTLGTKVEVKNMNSFRGVYNALRYETSRQIRQLEGGERIVQETRGWVDEKRITVSQRTKEYASDYRYFPEPDLPPLEIDQQLITRIRESIPELPKYRMDRFVEDYGLSKYDAEILTDSIETADFFESVVNVRDLNSDDRHDLAKSASNWIMGELARHLNADGVNIKNLKFNAKDFVELLELVKSGVLSNAMGKVVFGEMFRTGANPSKFARTSGMVQISDPSDVKSEVDQVISSNPNAVKDYLEGKDTAVKFLVGQVMKQTKGKADPKITNKILTEKLESMR